MDFRVDLRRGSSGAEEIAPLLHRAGEKELDDGESSNVEIPETAHRISSDSWLQVGFVLITGVNSAYILEYSSTIMIPLGWITGVLCSLAVTAISLYANSLLAMLHEYGGRRHIRYRDLAGFIYDKRAYYFIWGLQYINLFMINAGYIILGGSALKAACVSFAGEEVLKLPYCITIAGFVCVLFAVGIPHLSALKIWLGVSALFTLVYTTITFGLVVKDGLESSDRDYSIPGTTTSRIFTTIGAIAALFFTMNTGMLPEIQATVRKPVVENMLWAVVFHYTAGLIPMFAITFVGYWAYGSSTSSYLLTDVSGPGWLKASANISAFLQSVISLHIFASPIYEFMDTEFGVKGDPYSLQNFFFRAQARGAYLAVTTFISALMPFLGDFMSLTGALTTIPLAFIFSNHMYLVTKGDELSRLQKIWHWANVIFFTLLSVAAAVTGVRLIIVDVDTYHFFADL